MFIFDLWLSILLSAVAVFVVSSVVHMVLPIHCGDYKKLAGEAGVLEAMRNHGVQPGDYMFPCPASMKDMSSPEMIEKFKQGPVGFMTVKPGGVPSMGTSLVQWFLYSVLVGVFVAYIGGLCLARPSEFMTAFRVTGTIATLGYALSSFPDSIWKGVRWSTTLKFVFDGVLYGLATGLVFGLLWPSA